MTSIWFPALCAAALLGAEPAATENAQAPPMDEGQIARVRELVKLTRAGADDLGARLIARQRELAAVYAAYELDEARAQALQAEIVELQRRLLASHHRMQVALRKIVGKERFEVLRQRLGRHLAAPAPKEGNEAPARAGKDPAGGPGGASPAAPKSR